MSSSHSSEIGELRRSRETRWSATSHPRAGSRHPFARMATKTLKDSRDPSEEGSVCLRYPWDAPDHRLTGKETKLRILAFYIDDRIMLSVGQSLQRLGFSIHHKQHSREISEAELSHFLIYFNLLFRF